MKSEIIEMLDFPRKIVQGHVPFETCAHAGNFAPHDEGCLVCEARVECEWLYHNDESVALTEKSLDVIVDALGSAILYVDACVTRAGHNPRTCSCNACDWLGQAQRLHDDARSAR
jgi:hypothetical protein